MMFEKIKNLTEHDKREYLSKYLKGYNDDVISKFTNSKELVNNIINDNTIMFLVVELIDREEARQNKILVMLEAPFESEFFT